MGKWYVLRIPVKRGRVADQFIVDDVVAVNVGGWSMAPLSPGALVRVARLDML